MQELNGNKLDAVEPDAVQNAAPDQNAVLDEYVRRLKKEAWIKSAFCAGAIGSGTLLLTALICWLTAFGGYWLLAIAFLAPVGALLPVFYYYAFYPSKQYVAKRLDKLGLDERILTMFEFGGQDSYIMKLQRADAISTLSRFNSKLVEMALSVAFIVPLAVVAPTAVTMLSVYAASEAGAIPTGKELLLDAYRDKTTYELIYQASFLPDENPLQQKPDQPAKEKKTGGILYSASNPQGAKVITQKVAKGGDGEVVIPQAIDGYVFVGWSDGVRDCFRSDTAVQGKIVVTAIFEKAELNYESNEKTDGADLLGGGKGGEGEGEGEPSPPDPNSPPSEPGNPNDDPPNHKGGDRGNVFDGQTDYSGAPYQEAVGESNGELSQGGVDGDSAGVASDYMEAIK